MNDERAILVLFAAGEPDAAQALAGDLGADAVRALEPAGGSGAARIAAALVAGERAILEESPAAVVLCGPGPEVGAAALVAAKLGVPLARVTRGPGAGDDPAALADLDGPVAERLADLVVPGGDDPRQAADAIRAWLATYTLSP